MAAISSRAGKRRESTGHHTRLRTAGYASMLGDVEQRDGRACPMGVSHTPLGGINFAVHASDASAVMLRLYRSVEDEDPQAVFVMQRTVRRICGVRGPWGTD